MSSIINDNWLSPAVQFLLTGYDVQQETAWRDSQVRTWRQEDVRWMADERLAAASEELATNLQKRHWRKDTRDQTHNNNAAYRWQSYKARTKAEVSLKLEQLKGVAFMSAVLAGFATVSFTQFNYDTTSVPDAVNWVYALTTAFAVGLSSNAMVLATIVQASLLKSHRRYVNNVAEAEYFAACVRFIDCYGFGMTPIQPDRRRARSFDVFWKHRYGPAFRTIYLLFLASFPTFVANVAVAVWIVFNPAPVEPDGVTASAANVSDTATAIDNSMSMLGNTTAGSQSQEEPPSFSEGIPISINIVLGVCLVFCLILAQRFMLHVLGRGASQRPARQPARGLPFDWDCLLLPGGLAGRHYTVSSSGRLSHLTESSVQEEASGLVHTLTALRRRGVAGSAPGREDASHG